MKINSLLTLFLMFLLPAEGTELPYDCLWSGCKELKMPESSALSEGFASFDITYVHEVPTVFFIDNEKGSDSNSGTSPNEAWKTLDRVNQEHLIPGDSVLLKSGTTFYGSLKINNSGTTERPVTISKYGGTELPVIDAKGYLAGIHISNSGNVHISNLEITSDGGTVQETEALTARYGVYVTASQEGEFSDLRFENLNIHHIFATENIESDGQNPTSNMGMGIHVNMGTHDAVIKNVHIENCDIYMTGHTGIKIFGSGYWPYISYLDSVTIVNNRLKHIGGPGMVPGKCSNVHVQGNVVDYSGSSFDRRMHNRGSGIWPWTCKNVRIENNQFMNAWGKYDSCGAHIDFNCSNVIIQNNLSIGNAGGFVEILGNNRNCVYRYNISINDGYRIEGIDGALSDGYMFWLSNWTGKNNDPVGASDCRIYNNTIYVAPHIQTKILFGSGTHSNRIENNIIYVEGELSYSNHGENNTFNNNIYFGNIPSLPFGNGAFFVNPLLENPGDTLPESYRIKENSPAINTGQQVDSDVKFDFYGDTLSGYLPVDRGADESSFNKKMYTIESTAEEEGGNIFPAGLVSVPESSDIPFQIVANPGYIIQEIRVDNAVVETESVYTFQNLNAGHSIHVDFFAPADSVTDPLNDLSIVDSHSSNIKIQNENPGNFEGDNGRAVRINTEQGYLIYNFKEITGFEIVLWGVSNEDAMLKVYASENGLDFTDIGTKIIHHEDQGFRFKTIFTELSAFPEGINFLKFEITGSDAAWKIQLGSVKIKWLGDERMVTKVQQIKQKELTLYPNPARSRIYLQGVASGTRVKIISPEGKIQFIHVNQNYLDISGLPSGIYFLSADGYSQVSFLKIRN